VREGYTAFDAVLREADVLSLHCPLTDATRGLIGEAELAAMKPTAILVNTSRGGLVDETALARALRERRIGAAGFDVLSQEPPRDGNPLLAPDIPNLILTPHVAWASREAMQALADQVIDNIEAFAAGAPRNRLA
jgi:glycerate dehydrogenase